MAYVLLAVCGLVPAAWLTYRRHDAARLATFFPAAALVDMADWIAYSVLGLYQYHPGLVRHPVLDETIGVVCAEIIFVSSLTVLLVGRTPRWAWAALGAAVVTVLQVWFTAKGLLVLRGWTWWLNAAGFLVYFWLLDTYHAALQRDGWAGWPRLLGQAGVVGTAGALYALVGKVAGAYIVYVNLLPTEARNQSLARLVLDVGVTIPLGLWVLRGTWLNQTGRVVAATVGMILFNYVRVAIHLQHYRAPWSPLTDGLLAGLFLAAAALADAWIEQSWKFSLKV